MSVYFNVTMVDSIINTLRNHVPEVEEVSKVAQRSLLLCSNYFNRETVENAINNFAHIVSDSDASGDIDSSELANFVSQSVYNYFNQETIGHAVDTCISLVVDSDASGDIDSTELTDFINPITDDRRDFLGNLGLVGVAICFGYSAFRLASEAYAMAQFRNSLEGAVHELRVILNGANAVNREKVLTCLQTIKERIQGRRFSFLDLQNIPASLRNDPEIAKLIVFLHPNAMTLLSDELRNDPDIFQIALAQYPEAVEYLGEAFLDDGEFMFERIQIEPYSARYLGPNLENNIPFLLSLIRLHPDMMDWVIERHLLHPQFRQLALGAVQIDGRMLARLQEYSNDLEVVRAAVTQAPEALVFARYDARNDFSILQAVYDHDPSALAFAGLDATRDPQYRLRFPLAPEFGVSSRGILDLGPVVNANDHEVDFEEASKNPRKILMELLPKMTGGRFPRIHYRDSMGIDLDGLSRDLVTRLFTSIFDPIEPHLPMKAKAQEEKYIPVLEKASEISEADQYMCYKALGAIFAAALQESKSIITGSHLQPAVFAMLHTLSNKMLLEIDRNDKKEWHILFAKMVRAYVKAEMPLLPEEWLTRILCNRFDDEFRALSGYESKDHFLETIGFDKVILAVVALAKGLKENLSDPAQWDKLKGKTPEDLRRAIEGTLSAEQVKSALEWIEPEIASEEPIANTKAALEAWIDNASMSDLEGFVWAITGSRGLSPNRTLLISLVNSEDALPGFHTCTATMDLPYRYKDGETLKLKLETAIQESLAAPPDLV